jgi:hypothetical protein
MTDQGPLGRPPRGASVPGGAPCGAGPQLMGIDHQVSMFLDCLVHLELTCNK